MHVCVCTKNACMHVCIYVCVPSMHVCVYPSMHVCVLTKNACMRTKNACMHVCLCTKYAYMCMYHVCVYVCVPKYACMCAYQVCMYVCVPKYRKYRSLGTPPRLTFQARLLHNQEGANVEKGGFRKISSRAFFRRIGRCSHPEQSSLESQSRGCAKTPILTVCMYVCVGVCMCVFMLFYPSDNDDSRVSPLFQTLVYVRFALRQG